MAARRAFSITTGQSSDELPFAPSPRSGIQNGGVIRMSEMSRILWIPLYRDTLSHHEPM
jgi:hypothetical protein